jgi:ArsR family metal-binding transcriptional regulator
MKMLTVFPSHQAQQRTITLLDDLSLPYEVVDAAPAFARVGAGAIVLEEEARSALLASGRYDLSDCGWVECDGPLPAVPQTAPPKFEDDIVGQMVIVVLAPCVAEAGRLRLIAHLSGDLGEALPYLNAELPQASFVPSVPVLTFMHGPRMISLFRNRVTIAKAAHIVDAWATLEEIRVRLNEVWSRRASLTPSYEPRRKPPMIEIYKRLPQTNCRQCGEPTCLAFAASLWRGEADPTRCRPVFSGEHAELADALLQMCASLGL